MTTRHHLLLWGIDDRDLEHALAALDVRLSVVRGTTGTPLAAGTDLASIDGLIMSAARISAPFLERLRHEAPRLRWLHLTSAGYDNVGDFSLPSNATVTYTPGAGATTVAEHGVGLMLALARRIPDALAEQRRRHWSHALGGRLTSLQGRTAVILGFGHIGKALARLLHPFCMRLIVVNRHGETSDPAMDGCTLAEVDVRLPEADFVIIALPLTPETNCFFDAGRLARLGPHAFLVNLSRGAIVDCDALSDQLLSGNLAGAAIDVTSPEPLPASHPLWSAPNLILTPHSAAAGPTPEDRARMITQAVENSRRFLNGETLLHVVHSCSNEP